MPYVLNRPTATELQSVSQSLIQGNFNAANTSFNVEHYAFADVTSENGFHNTVTQPLILPIPPSMTPVHPTTTTNPIIYAMQDSANIGTIQYSRGPVFNAYVPAPTPITELHSNSAVPIVLAPSATSPVLNFTGINNAIGSLYIVNWDPVANVNIVSECIFGWNAAAPAFALINSSNNNVATSLVGAVSGTTLAVKNNNAGTTFSNIFWTLRFHRINK